jgi:hypothetical protein
MFLAMSDMKRSRCSRNWGMGEEQAGNEGQHRRKVLVGRYRLRLDYLPESTVKISFDQPELGFNDVGVEVLALHTIEVAPRGNVAWPGLESAPFLHVADEQLARVRSWLGKALQIELGYEMVVTGTPAGDRHADRSKILVDPHVGGPSLAA